MYPPIYINISYTLTLLFGPDSNDCRSSAGSILIHCDHPKFILGSRFQSLYIHFLGCSVSSPLSVIMHRFYVGKAMYNLRTFQGQYNLWRMLQFSRTKLQDCKFYGQQLKSVTVFKDKLQDCKFQGQLMKYLTVFKDKLQYCIFQGH